MVGYITLKLSNISYTTGPHLRIGEGSICLVRYLRKSHMSSRGTPCIQRPGSLGSLYQNDLTGLIDEILGFTIIIDPSDSPYQKDLTGLINEIILSTRLTRFISAPTISGPGRNGPGPSSKTNDKILLHLKAIPEKNKPYKEQVDAQVYPWILFDRLPGLFHFPAPVDIIKDHHRRRRQLPV